VPIHVTYFSPTYRKQIQSTPEVFASYPSPWEKDKTIQEYLEYHQPRAYLVSRTDAWPLILSGLQDLQIPRFMFSATLTKDSKRTSSVLSRLLSGWILKKFSSVFCVTSEDQNCFAELGVKAKVLGDTRYDQVLWRIKNPRELKQALRPQTRHQVIVCGSTWPEDEAILLPAMAKLRSQWRWIMAPHEPTPQHVSNLIAHLKDLGLSHSLYSQSKQWDTDVLIVDQVGILADLYAWGAVAFVGGSFKKTVHSVMEPLAQDCWTLVGPLHKNNREAQKFQNVFSKGQSAVQVFEDSEGLIKILNASGPADGAVRSEIEKMAGASQQLVKSISPLC
jgi:3-deoxy-D-manno-octulosonic-acid transferase